MKERTDLHFFLEVERTGSYRAAAVNFGMSRQGVRGRIDTLESSLGGVELFQKEESGQLKLSRAGKEFHPHAVASVDELDAGRAKVLELSEGKRGYLAIGAGGTACSYLLPEPLSQHRKRYPGVELRIHQQTTPDIIHNTLYAKFDFGIVFLSRHTVGEATVLPHAGGLVEPLMVDPLVIVSAPKLPLARRGTNQPFVAFPEGDVLRTELEAELEKAHVNATIAVEAGSLTVIKRMVKAGLGFALLSRLSCMDEIDRGELVERPELMKPRPRHLALFCRGQIEEKNGQFVTNRILSSNARRLYERILRSNLPKA